MSIHISGSGMMTSAIMNPLHEAVNATPLGDDANKTW